HTQVLERRITPGSYAVYSPSGDQLTLDGHQWCMHVKYGDGQEKRKEKYTTHSPSFDFHYRPAKKIVGQGQTMEKTTLMILEKMYPYQIKVQLSPTGKPLEWYRLSLGGSQKKAKAAKRTIVAVLNAYAALPEDATTAQLNAYRQSVFNAFRVAMGTQGQGLNDEHLAHAGEFLQGHSTVAH
ncbi:hypothetical protein H0H87_010312, partial [Tephrocybe sp. NHM501043]